MGEARITIGAWTASPALNQLENGTRTIRIEPRAMDVLMALAQRGGEVVSVDELIASVWKGVIVGDGSVYLAISQLRQALEDPSGETRYIETIPKRGYRLTVPVERAEQAEAAEPAAPVAPPVRKPATVARWTVRPLYGWLGAAIAAALVVAIVVAVTYRQAAPPIPANSVAVLPFANLSSDPQQEYFADGVTEEILNTLAAVGDLRVTGRTSSFHFKERKQDLRTIGEALGVEHVLEGSVRRAGDQVRITAQLSNARTGYRLWSQTYQRKVDDIFAIQDEIAHSVADALQVKLGVGDIGRRPGMTRNVAAYDEYLRGMALNLQWRPESPPLAIAHLQRAVALDPEFSIGWAGLSSVYANGTFLVPERADEWRQKGTEAREQARVLTPDAPHVLLEIGIAEARRGNFLEAAATFERLQGSYVRHGMANQAWAPRGVFMLSVGRVREAIGALERARAEEPLAPAIAGFLGEANLAAGNFDVALAEVDRGLTLEGLEASLRAAGLVIALSRGDRKEVERRLAAIPGGDPGARLSLGLARLLDAPAGAAAEIRRLALGASPSQKALLAAWAAYYRAPDLALELLTEAGPGLSRTSVLWQPLMKDVRRLPGFGNVVRELGLVDYWRRYGWPDFCHPTGEDAFACE